MSQEPENDQERRARNLQELQGKNIAHYSQILGAWIQTNIEHDKILITLSAAGVGLLVTILSTVGSSSLSELLLFGLSLIFFIFTIWMKLKTLEENAERIEQELRAPEGGSKELNLSQKKLRRLDKYSKRIFVAAVVCAATIGIIKGIHTLTLENQEMPNNPENVVRNTRDHAEVQKHSLADIQNVRPAQPAAGTDTEVSQSPAQEPASDSGSSTSTESDNSGSN